MGDLVTQIEYVNNEFGDAVSRKEVDDFGNESLWQYDYVYDVWGNIIIENINYGEGEQKNITREWEII